LTSNVRASRTAKPPTPPPARIAEHADHDVVAGHAVDGVRARVTRLGHELARLDHLLDARPPGVVGDVDHMDARRRKPGTIRCERCGPWHAELQRFQPK
jgi:hypothetical protein